MRPLLNFDDVEKTAVKFKGINPDNEFSPKIIFIYVSVAPYCTGIESRAYKDDNGKVVIKHTKSMVSGKGFVESVSPNECLVNFGIASIWVNTQCITPNNKREFELNNYVEEY